MRRPWLWVVLALVVIAAIAAIVTSGNNNSSTKTTTPTPSPQPTSTTPPPSSETTTDKVSIQNMSFSPDTLTVKKGTTVTWTNNDSITHTVTADSGSGPKSGNLANGEKYTFKFDSVGTFNYHCAIHPSMTAKVIVTD